MISMKIICSLAFVLCVVLPLQIRAAALPDELTEEALLNHLQSIADGGDFLPNVAEKRYSEGRYTSIKSASQDRAAFRKLIRALIGKRSQILNPAEKRSGIEGQGQMQENAITTHNGIANLGGWFILAGKIDNDLLNEAFNRENDL